MRKPGEKQIKAIEMRAVIIEDEELIAHELKQKVREVVPGLEIAAILQSLKVARRWLMQNTEPDLWLMDVQLSDGVSFKLFEEFSLSAPVIFTTAYDEYAIRAFKTNGVDYLLKPVGNEDLAKAIAKCRDIVDSRQKYPAVVMDFLKSLRSGDQPGHSSRYKQKFIVHTREGWRPVNTDSVAAFEKDTLFYLHTFQGERFILSFESMDEIEELLDPDRFYRANRQWIISSESVRSVRSLDNFKLVVTLSQPSNRQIDISREKASAFKKWLDR